MTHRTGIELESSDLKGLPTKLPLLTALAIGLPTKLPLLTALAIDQ